MLTFSSIASIFHSQRSITNCPPNSLLLLLLRLPRLRFLLLYLLQIVAISRRGKIEGKKWSPGKKNRHITRKKNSTGKKQKRKKKESLLERLFVIDFECKTAFQECRFFFLFSFFQQIQQ
jgi:hypothetical protein